MKNNLYWECEKCGWKTARHPDTKPEEMPLCHQIDAKHGMHNGKLGYSCCAGKMIPKEYVPDISTSR